MREQGLVCIFVFDDFGNLSSSLTHSTLMISISLSDLWGNHTIYNLSTLWIHTYSFAQEIMMQRLSSSLSRKFSVVRGQGTNLFSNQCKSITVRNLSSSQLTNANSNDQIQPPSSINKEMAMGIQSSTKMYIKHGIGYQRLVDIAKDGGETKTLVTRWQRMMEAFLGTQVHVIAGLGYSPNENGLREFSWIDFKTIEYFCIDFWFIWMFFILYSLSFSSVTHVFQFTFNGTLFYLYENFSCNPMIISDVSTLMI